jgi:hypothetical protein
LQKVTYSGLIILVITGCSVFKGKDLSQREDWKADNNISIPALTRNNNLTENSFYISSMDIAYSDGKTSNKLSGSFKFEKPDKYLISLRSKGGIEVARIFINNDSLYILERLNHKVYVGSLNYIRRNYGFPATILPLLIGDFIGNCKNYLEEGNDKRIEEVRCIESGVEIKYYIDKSIGKVVSVDAEGNRRNELISISYDKFIRKSSAVCPTKIILTNKIRNLNAEIKINKIVFPWTEKIEFNIGNKYQILELL